MNVYSARPTPADLKFYARQKPKQLQFTIVSLLLFPIEILRRTQRRHSEATLDYICKSFVSVLNKCDEGHPFSLEAVA